MREDGELNGAAQIHEGGKDRGLEKGGEESQDAARIEKLGAKDVGEGGNPIMPALKLQIRAMKIAKALLMIVVALIIYVPEKLYRWIFNKPYHGCSGKA